MLSLLCMASMGIYAQKQFTLASPDGKVSTTITVGDMLQYSISIDGQQVLAPSPISMTLSTGEVWGQKPALRGNKRSSVNQNIASPLYRDATLTDNYNAITLNFRKDYSVEFRAYNDGVAYRFTTTRKTPFNVVSDGATFNFDKDYTMTASYVRDGKDGDWASQFANSFENTYTVEKLSKFNTGHLTFLPVVVDAEKAKVDRKSVV